MPNINFDISTEVVATLANTAKDSGFTKDAAGVLKYIKVLIKRTYVNQKEKEVRVGLEDSVEAAKTTAESVVI